MTKQQYINNLYTVQTLYGVTETTCVCFTWTFGKIKYEVYTHVYYKNKVKFVHDIFKEDSTGNLLLNITGINEIKSIPNTIQDTIKRFEDDVRKTL